MEYCDGDPCDGATCASNPEDTTCVTSYCGDCKAVFYDYDGKNVVNCESKYLKGILSKQGSMIGSIKKSRKKNSIQS